MTRHFTLFFLSLFFSLFNGSFLYAAASGRAVVATAHPYASEAAAEVLKQGGNAVDAAIAAQWVLNVVEPQSSGIGGGGFFLFYDAAAKKIYAFDGREKAPVDVAPSMYLDEHGVPIPYIPDRVTGGHSVGVPGTLKLLKTVFDRFSSDRFTFEDLFEPAIHYAEKGIMVSPRLARFIGQQKDRLGLFAASRKIFFDAEGKPLQKGALLVQKDLAATFRLIQARGIDVFYDGEIADAIVDAVRNAPYRPGKMRKSDLYYYEVALRDAAHGSYRGYDIFSMGPPSSGGTTLIETLHILENTDLGHAGRSGEAIHLFSEAQKLAFRDRNRYLGDPDHSLIPTGKILSKGFAKSKWHQINPKKAMPPAEPQQDLSGTHTSHISIVDAGGNMVSYTTTIEHIFGSAMMVPGRGFLLNNELSDFDAEPVVGGQLHPNAPSGEKRPRSSMTPTLVFKDGDPFLIVGSPGGSTIIATVLNIIVNMIDFRMDLQKAVAAPRILNRDGAMELETRLFLNERLVQSLRAMGHEVTRNGYFGNAQAASFDAETGRWTGVSDPRGEGQALAIS